jgi:nucleotide-binding universal stress UspA family protein
MALKDIMVYVGADRRAGARIALALALARLHGAHVTGLHVKAIPVVPAPIDAAFVAELVATLERNAEAEAGASRKAFEDATRNTDVPVEWRGVDGRLPDTAILHARHADLTLVGQPDPAEGGDPVGLVESLIMESGRPVLVVPRQGNFASLGERVLIAWNGSREAMRAIVGALPILERAAAARILVVNAPEAADEAALGRLPGADLAVHLSRHGITTEVTDAPSGGAETGELVMARATDLGADLIVMGAYGHSRLRELVLGGATRTVLQRMSLPVLMAH